MLDKPVITTAGTNADPIKNSISFNDVEIKKNNLEEIFLKLIDQ